MKIFKILKKQKHYNLWMMIVNGILSILLSGISFGLIYKHDIFPSIVFFAFSIATLINMFDNFDRFMKSK